MIEMNPYGRPEGGRNSIVLHCCYQNALSTYCRKVNEALCRRFTIKLAECLVGVMYVADRVVFAGVLQTVGK